MILGNIRCSFMSKDDEILICSSILTYCKKHNIGVHFENNNAEACKDIVFQLSDNFHILHCEQFLEPIIFTFEGIPIVDSINKDLNTLEGLIKDVFLFNTVKEIELRFSYVEVDECEYEKMETDIYNMKSVILSQYLKSIQFPVIKIIIKNN